MQSVNLPTKFLVPFATNDSARVELPVTTSTVGRASQSLGFPPITGQPPETGGQPPQLEDFNGAINQIARIAWWSQLGGTWNYDATFASNTNINGYQNGAILATSDSSGSWLSLADNNTVNPDTVGTNWAPAWAYGLLSLTGQTGGTTTLTPLQAIKHRISVAGALISNLVIAMPAWIYAWDVTNNTSGAFTLTVKTPSGTGAIIPQNGSPTPIRGDGTNIAAYAPNVPTATNLNQAVSLGQATGRWLNTQVFSIVGTFTYTPTSGTTKVRVKVQGGGGGGGGTGSTATSQLVATGGGGAGGYVESLLSSGFAGASVVVGAGGNGAIGVTTNATPGNASSFGGTLVASGGGSSQSATAATASGFFGGAVGGAGSGGTITNAAGGNGSFGIQFASSGNFTNGAVGGPGGASIMGAGGVGGVAGTSGSGGVALNKGAGGGGAAAGQNSGPQNGGNGGIGLVIIEEYA